MKYMDFIVYGPKAKHRRVSIAIRQLGIPQFVLVRTKGNGGIN